MLILPGFTKQPWYVAAETEDHWVDIHTHDNPGKPPYVDSEAGKDLYLEAIAEEWGKNPLRPKLKMIHCWPLAWGELTR